MKNKIIGAGLVIIIVNILSKIVNFGKEIYLANCFGTNIEIEAYIIATTIPVVLTGIFAAAINTTLIPILTEIKQKRDRKELFGFFNLVIIIISIIMIIITICIVINPNMFVVLIAPGFDDRAIELTNMLLRISAINTLLITVVYAYISLLNVEGYYTIVATISLVLNIPMMLYLMISNNITIINITIYYVIGVALQFLVVIFYLIKIKYNYSFVSTIKREKYYINELLHLSSQSFLINGVYQINTLVDRMQASKLIEGSIAALEYSNKIVNLAMGLITTAIVTIIYPILSKFVVEKENNKLIKYINNSINLVLIIMIPISIGIITYSKELVEIFYSRGAFNKESVYMTSGILRYAAIGITFVSIKEILFRVFYSMKEHKKATINSIFGVIVNIVLNILLSNIMGARGLALATSISSIVTTILLILQLKKINKQFEYNQIIVFFLKIGVISLVSIIISKNIYEFNIIDNNILNLIVSCTISIILYIIFLLTLKINEIRDLIKILIKNK